MGKTFKFFKLFIPKQDREILFQDFEMLYQNMLREKGKFYAFFWLWLQILKSLPGLISANLYWKYIITKNYGKIAVRNILKNKYNSFINISGLSIGIVCFVLICLYIQDDLSYDRYHKNAEDIYRIVKVANSGNGLIKQSAYSPSLLAPSLKFEYPDKIKEITRFWHYWGLGFNVKYQDNVFKEKYFVFADSTVFKVFDFEFINGDSKTALDAPYKVVITESTAHKYFGDVNPIGKTLRVNDGYDVFVSGIIKDVPAHSHFHFNFLTSFSTLAQMPWKDYLTNWYEDFCYSYVLLNDNVNPDDFTHVLSSFYEKYLPPDLQNRDTYYFQPLVDIHLKSNLVDEIEPGSGTNRLQLLILFSIGLFILIIAILNYVNLTTAYYAVRIKEIGVRKVLGSKRINLFFQFIEESTIFVFLALIFSLVFIQIILPQFNHLIGKNISFDIFKNPIIWGYLLLFGILLGLFSGIYPALFVSSFRPIDVLANISKKDIKKGIARKIFVFSQLVIASFLIIGTLIILQQLKFINSYNVHFDKDNIIILSVNQSAVAAEHYESFINEITQSPNVFSAVGLRTITGYEHMKESFTMSEFTSTNAVSQIPILLIRHNFLETLGIDVVSGRGFSKKFPTDKEDAVLINESLAKQLGVTYDNIIGKKIKHLHWGDQRIVGIVKDFNFESLHLDIKPLVIKMIWPWRQTALTDYIAVRIGKKDVAGSIQFIEEKWKKFVPNIAFEQFSLDQKLDQFYNSEIALSRMVSIFTFIAIVIACLGLLGFISFVVEWKTKEIAMRKVLGASVTNVVHLISKEFLLLVLISNILAWPMAYLAANKWLHNFAFRVNIPFWIFIIAAILIIFLSLLTILFYTSRTALKNPVNFLRYE